jgi:hypothetical protein
MNEELYSYLMGIATGLWIYGIIMLIWFCEVAL